jgi:hypothetical protein
MVNHYVMMLKNIFPSIGFGLNVNTVINKMLKTVMIIGTVVLVGCAGQPRQPEKPYQPADMKNFVAGCNLARSQIDFLTQKINEYHEYHRTRPITLEDRRYYGQLKNNLWSLRSTCSAKQL